MTTLKDIARIAEVSISTVSKALNDSSEIRPETRERIVRIARDLKYNFGTRGAEKSSHSKIIGVVCPEVNSNYYAQLVNSISENVSRREYSFMIGVTDFSPEKEELFIKLFIEKGVDGIIFITENEHTQEVINNVGISDAVPVVLIVTDSDVKNLDYIKINDAYGVELAVEHLLRLGHRRIAYLGDNLTMNRYNAYVRLMRGSGIEPDADLTRISGERFEEGGYLSMKEILTLKNRPTAVFAAYDDIAIGAMRAVTEAGLRVPEDVSVIGIDNVAVCPYLTRSLTTVSNPVKEMAAVSVSIIVKKIESNDFRVVQHVVLQPELIVRETTTKA